MISGRKILAYALAALALCAGPAAAVITPSINYQGFLLSKVTNLPVDTPQDLRFYIYSVPTGGAPLFTEARSKVRVSKGRYDVEIGSVTPGGIPGTIFMDYNALWLEVQVDASGAGAFEPMTPRVKLQASPYSFNSLYASTASAATSNFRADVIGALPQTTYGAITISTNLFVQGGISVGSISPGQKLSVAGVVESTGNWPACATAPDYTCGFKFPDGSVQVKAAALTMWDVMGINLYTINEGNTNVGGGLTVPSARLHISSAAGDSGPLLLVSTGTGNSGQSQLFMVNGNGQVYGNSFYGDGSTLGGVVRKAGDTMTGQLTLAATSSFTVLSAAGASAARVRFAPGVEISSAAQGPSFRGGIAFSSHVYLMPGATIYGDGSGLTNLITQDYTKVLKAGDTMTGSLTMQNSSITITGGAFGVTGSTFSIFGGSVAVGGFSYPVRLAVTGGIQATSSITALAGMYAASFNSPAGHGTFQGISVASGTYWAYGPTQYSILAATSIVVSGGYVQAPFFVGDGSRLSAVQGNDASRVLKAGDTMTGNLTISGSSITIAPAASHQLGLAVGRADSIEYAFAVSTGGNVGVQVNDPTAPLDVKERVLVSNIGGGPAHLDISTLFGPTYLRWSEGVASNQGVLGFPTSSGDFLYSAGGTVPGIDGQEVFRIKADSGGANWRYGIGTNSPAERFHVAVNMLVSTNAATNPIFFVSTATNRVGIRTLSPSHALEVNGGIHAVSSITAQAGFYGSGIGLTGIPAGALPQTLHVGSITAVAGGAYDGVVFSTTVYASSKLSVGSDAGGAPFDPSAGVAMHVRGPVRLDQQGGESVKLEFFPNFGGDSYMTWTDAFVGASAAMGVEGATHDMLYRRADSNLQAGSGGDTPDLEVFRIKYGGQFTVGAAGSSYVSPEPFRVLTNMAVGAAGVTQALFVSTMATGGFYGSVGISTGIAKERFHVASSMLVGGDRAAAVLFVSTRTGNVGVGTGYPQANLDVAGFAQFQSSLTVNGAGLSGTQTAFAVLGSTLIVRNDGRVGVGVPAPQSTLDVNGSARFGSGAARSTFTAEGYWQPRSMTTLELGAAAPTAVGQVVYNATISDLCVSTGIAVGQWALVGSKGAGNCF